MRSDQCVNGPCARVLTSTISIVHDASTRPAVVTARSQDAAYGDGTNFEACNAEIQTRVTGLDVDPATGECFAVRDIKCCRGESEYPGESPGPYVASATFARSGCMDPDETPSSGPACHGQDDGHGSPCKLNVNNDGCAVGDGDDCIVSRCCIKNERGPSSSK